MSYTKKEIILIRADLNLHMYLLMKQENVNKATALWMIYAEGKDGLQRRMGQKVFDLGPLEKKA